MIGDMPPKPPAQAFSVVAALLDADYFTTPPPPAGLRITAAGRDRINTTWDLDVVTGTAVAGALRARPDITLVKTNTYEVRA